MIEAQICPYKFLHRFTLRKWGTGGEAVAADAYDGEFDFGLIDYFVFLLLVEPGPKVDVGGDHAANDDNGTHYVDPVPARAVRLLVFRREAAEV